MTSTAPKRVLIAFDVDGTLIDRFDKPRLHVVGILINHMHAKNVDVIVWSGGGKEYAELWGRRLNLPAGVTYMAKTNQVRPNIAYDDVVEFDMADIVIIV